MDIIIDNNDILENNKEFIKIRSSSKCQLIHDMFIANGIIFEHDSHILEKSRHNNLINQIQTPHLVSMILKARIRQKNTFVVGLLTYIVISLSFYYSKTRSDQYFSLIIIQRKFRMFIEYILPIKMNSLVKVYLVAYLLITNIAFDKNIYQTSSLYNLLFMLGIDLYKFVQNYASLKDTNNKIKRTDICIHTNFDIDDQKSIIIYKTKSYLFNYEVNLNSNLLNSLNTVQLTKIKNKSVLQFTIKPERVLKSYVIPLENIIIAPVLFLYALLFKTDKFIFKQNSNIFQFARVYKSFVNKELKYYVLGEIFHAFTELDLTKRSLELIPFSEEPENINHPFDGIFSHQEGLNKFKKASEIAYDELVDTLWRVQYQYYDGSSFPEFFMDFTKLIWKKCQFHQDGTMSNFITITTEKATYEEVILKDLTSSIRVSLPGRRWELRKLTPDKLIGLVYDNSDNMFATFYLYRSK